LTWNARAARRLLRYGAAADRGRIVREAIAVLLADLDARGMDSLLGPQDRQTPTAAESETPHRDDRIRGLARTGYRHDREHGPEPASR